MNKTLQIALGNSAYPAASKPLRRVVKEAADNHILGQMPLPAKGVLAPDDERILSELIENAAMRAERDKNRNAFEADRLQRALLGTGIKPIILKGCAYQTLGLKAGAGRRSSDLDILVERGDLEAVEKHLRQSGFIDHKATNNPYDQAYYRDYMHELPPLLHQDRRTLIDVHHALSPRTAAVQEDTHALIEVAVDLEGEALKVLSPVDRFLHAALHSVYDGDLTHPIRHMLDLAHLYEALAGSEKASVMVRAKAVGLEKPAALALRLIKRCTGRDIEVPKSPAPITEWVMVGAIATGDPGPLSAFYLYCRGHLLRMPFLQLVKHLAIKARRRLRLESAGPVVDRQTLEEHLR